jgi:hypothetical protein
MRLPIPPSEEPHVCRVQLECHQPLNEAGGGVAVFVNGTRVGRIESVYSHLAKGEPLVSEFTTCGGTVDVSYVFDESQKAPDPVDDRDLAVAVVRVAVFAPTNLASAPRAAAV